MPARGELFPISPLQQALEAAIVADPDDRASHMAYADWLHEQGDPRGTLIQIQLALEDSNTPARERKALQEQEGDLLARHREAWLGELAEPLLHPPETSYFPLRVDLTFARGWVQRLCLSNFRVQQTRALARAPELRLLRELILVEQAYEEAGEYEAGDDIPAGAMYYLQLYPLLRAGQLGNVRAFTLGDTQVDEEYPGCSTNGEIAVGIVKLMPRLEELRLLAHEVDTDELFALKTLGDLRVLQIFHCHNYPLEKLGANPSFGKLTTLLCHPHCIERNEAYIRLENLRGITRSKYLTSLTHLQLRCSDMGDAGAQEIAASGILKRLKVLDLKHGRISDAGAQVLAGCPDVKNLERLDLSDNCMTAEGIAALRAVVPGLVADGQWDLETYHEDEPEYLYHGDIE